MNSVGVGVGWPGLSPANPEPRRAHCPTRSSLEARPNSKLDISDEAVIWPTSLCKAAPIQATREAISSSSAIARSVAAKASARIPFAWVTSITNPAFRNDL